jgi:hypothetical protein
VRVRNRGGTSPAASTNALLPLEGTFGSFDAPKIVSVVVSDPDNSAPAYSDGDQIKITFDVPLAVVYRNWQAGGLAADPNSNGRTTAAGISGPRAFVNSLFKFSGKLGQDCTRQTTSCCASLAPRHAS